MASKRGRPPHNDLLTPAEWRTVNFVRHGLGNQQIADRRGISLDAVKFHVANAIAKLGLRNRRELKLWIGSPADSFLRKEGSAMNEEFNFMGVGQIARSVTDIAKTESWYRDVLGLDHLYTFGDLTFFDCAGTRLMFSASEGKAGDESLIYFRVPDINAAHQRLAAKGVEFTNAPHMIHKHDDGVEEWMAFFKDPEGRPLAILCAVGPADT